MNFMYQLKGMAGGLSLLLLPLLLLLRLLRLVHLFMTPCRSPDEFAYSRKGMRKNTCHFCNTSAHVKFVLNSYCCRYECILIAVLALVPGDAVLALLHSLFYVFLVPRSLKFTCHDLGLHFGFENGSK